MECNPANTNSEVIIMDQKKQQKLQQQKEQEEFNSITQKMKPENQNQTHNIRKEAVGPINQKR